MSTLSIFEIKDGVLTAYRGADAAVAVPEGVKSIGKGAFAGCAFLRSVTAPEGLVRIGPEAFLGCENLGNVTLPNSLQTVGERAFADCTALTSIVLHREIKRIPPETFSGCVRLQLVELPARLTHIGERAFLNCGSLETVKLPLSVRTIGKSAFEGCRRLSGAAIPPGVTAIEDKTFYLCETLHDLRLPQGLRRIGSSAFENCRCLFEAALPPLLSQIGSRAFAGTALRSVSLPPLLKTVGDRAFFDAPMLCGVAFQGDADAVSVGSEAFSRCPRLTDGNGLFILQNRLFTFFSNEKAPRAVVPDSVSVIERNAFAGLQEVHVEMPLKCPAWETLGEAESFGFGESILRAPGSTITFRDANGKTAAKVIAATEGESTRMQYTVYLSIRQKDGCFDFAAYDGVFGLLAKKKNKLLMALTRLKYPYMLAPEKKREYIDFIRNNDEAAGAMLIETEDMDALPALCGENVFSKTTAQRLAEVSAEKQLTQITALLLDYRERLGGGDDFFAQLNADFLLKGDRPHSEYSLSKAAGGALFRLRARGGEGEITAYLGSEETLVLPEKIGTVRLSALGERAFSGSGVRALRALTVPGWYTRFARGVFCGLQDCEVRFGEGIAHLPPELFELAQNLTVRLPRSLLSLGEQNLFNAAYGNTGNLFLVPKDSNAHRLCLENGWPCELCDLPPDELDLYARAVLKKRNKPRQ